ncbi:MAG TPA: AbrB/MazE/SpoVT family DNA-binding domain-containing protein [Methanosarcinales archaeon]|nr:AbrB/MazE/SpoVT family DNA-binding domain-containing protein [Methanosarcinales archaeon]
MKTSIKLGKNGKIIIPSNILEEYNFKQGDVFELVEIGGVITIYKAMNDAEIKNTMEHFVESLDKAGYKTKKDILKLVKEVKEELASH